MSYPDQGELFPAKQRKSDHLIFFVHFFQGNKKALKRHIEFVNELGYDAYAFTLRDSLKENYFLPYSHVSKKFGMKHALADQIEEHLNLLTEYKAKIVYAFSNVAGSAIEVLARRFSGGNHDVIALICDSGPGKSFFKSSYNLLQHQIGVKSLPLRLATTPLVAFGWSPSLHNDIETDLDKLPHHFPVLSIRGWRDKLISPSTIDAIFETQNHLDWKKLPLPEAGHLNGLRDFPSEYRPGVENFLSQIH